jgi:hypothetical protein
MTPKQARDVVPRSQAQAIAFVKANGVVLESARGPVPCLAEAPAASITRTATSASLKIGSCVVTPGQSPSDLSRA